jgi:hypothetical protein
MSTGRESRHLSESIDCSALAACSTQRARVLDHEVPLPSGEVVYNPMRVVPDGEACEVVFTLRRQQGMTSEEFERDAATVAADLATLKRLLESHTPAG